MADVWERHLEQHTQQLDCDRFATTPLARAIQHTYYDADEPVNHIIVLAYKCFFAINRNREPASSDELRQLLSECNFNRDELLRRYIDHVTGGEERMVALAKADCSQRTPGFEKLHECDDVCVGNRDDGIKNIADMNAALTDINNVPVTKEEFRAIYLENYYLTQTVSCLKCGVAPKKRTCLPCGCFILCQDCDVGPLGGRCLGCNGKVLSTITTIL